MALLNLIFFSLLASPVFTAPSSYPNNDTYAHPANGLCTDYTVTEEVTYNSVIWGPPKPRNNYDIAVIRANLAALNGSTIFRPFNGSEERTSTYHLSGTFCTPIDKKDGKEKTVLIATHGGGYDRRYWASTYKSDEYNFVQYALNRSYSVFYYDRLGTGKSQLVSGYEAQAANQIELVASIAKSIRGGKYTGSIKASKIVLVGHSLGSVFSAGAIAKYPDVVEGTVLTGAVLPNATDPSRYIRGFSPVLQDGLLASTYDPPFPRDANYIAIHDVYAQATAFFHGPLDIPTVEYAQSIVQPTSLVEMLSSGIVNYTSPAYKGHNFITTGQWDMLACGGDCTQRFEYGLQNETYPVAAKVETYLHPNAGHGVNFARDASVFYGKIVDFLDRSF